MSNEIISVDDIRKARRGRRMTVNADLLETLEGVTEGTAAVLSDTFGAVPEEASQKVQAEIRKHWRLAHGEDSACSIFFDPETRFAQVTPKV